MNGLFCEGGGEWFKACLVEVLIERSGIWFFGSGGGMRISLDW